MQTLSKMQTLSIARDFSRYPAGRYISDGPYNGETFREKFLVPVLQGDQEIEIDLDGTRGYGSSFLEEAFGGLVRLGFAIEKIKSSFHLKTKDKSLVEEINYYIDNGAEPRD